MSLRNKQGAVLVVSLWILIILVLLAVSAGRRVSIALKLLRYHLNRTQAFYLAQAGIERIRYEKTLDISGVGFKAAAQGTNLMLTLGFSHPIVYPLPKGIKATVDPKQTQITLKGVDKQLVGQIAANIRNLKKPEPYKGKGIKYSTEVIQRKEGKAGKGGK